MVFTIKHDENGNSVNFLMQYWKRKFIQLFLKDYYLMEIKSVDLIKLFLGLKQPARCWFEAFEQTLKQIGFENSEVEHCIYILDKGDIS